MVVDRLKPEWEHIPASEYGDGKDVTCKLLKREGQDIEYLYERLLELTEQSPVITTHHYPYAVIDEDKSFGIKKQGNNWVFDETTNFNIEQDFTTTDYIDLDKTTANINIDSGRVEVPINPPQLKKISWRDNKNYSKYLYCHRHTNLSPNEFWYVGWDKDKNYNLHAEYLKYWKNEKIPTVCRAQTFKVPSDFEDNNISKVYMEDITLKLQTHRNTGSPLLVELRTCEMKWASEKDKKADKGKTTPTHKTAYPSGKVIASKELTFNDKITSEKDVTIKWDKMPELTRGETYAIVLRSPLTCFDKAYGLGGWSTHCKTDIYQWGNAFTSFDNGKNWQIYGKADKRVHYRQGYNAPKDFGFEIDLKGVTSNTVKLGTEYEVYFKPLQLNPMEQLQLSADYTENKGSVKFYISHDFKKWEQIGGKLNGQDVSYIHDCKGKLFVFIKAVLKTSNTSGLFTDAPVIEQIDFNIQSTPAKRLYGRCYPINPQTEPALGLNVWGSIDAPLELQSAVNGKVDIISSDTCTERFRVIGSDEIIDYIDLVTDDEDTLESYREMETSDIIELFKNNKDFVKTYQENNIYILVDGLMPKAKYEDAGGSYEQRYYVPLINSPAYPIISCDSTVTSYDTGLLPTASNEEDTVSNILTTDATSWSEWLDYTVAYNSDATQYLTSDYVKADGDLLKFKDAFVFENVSEGITGEVDETTADGVEAIDLTGKSKAEPGLYTVTFNPLLVKDLTTNEMPFRLDYKKEVFIITKSNISDSYSSVDDIKYHNIVDTNNFILYMKPNCMLRRVILNKDTDNERELVEDRDFSVDYDKRVVTLIGDLGNGLGVGETLEVDYVPDVRDTGLAIAYRLHRTSTGSKGYIKPNTYSYRT